MTPPLSNTPRTVIAIRTHRWDTAEQKLYQTLQDYFADDDIYVVVEELTSAKDVPQHIQKVSLNCDLLARLQLPSDDVTGWRFGDYSYYALAESVKADFYWLLESDVVFHFSSVTPFFQAFEYNISDSVLMDLQPAPQDWGFLDNAKIIREQDPKGCFFPLSRLSANAIQCCLAERQRVTPLFTDRNLTQPSDEILVANALANAQLSMQDIMQTWQFHVREGFTSKERLYIDREAVAELPPNLILHPVHDQSFFVQTFFQLLQTMPLPQALENFCQRAVLAEKGKLLTETFNQVFGCLITQLITQYLNQNGTKKQKIWMAYLSRKLKLLNAPQSALSIWNHNIAVLDIPQHETIFTLEYELQTTQIVCNVFNRQGKPLSLQDWQPYFPNAITVNHKIQLQTLDHKMPDLDKALTQLGQAVIQRYTQIRAI